MQSSRWGVNETGKEEAGGERLKDVATANQRKDPESTSRMRRITLKLRTGETVTQEKLGRKWWLTCSAVLDEKITFSSMF